MAYLDSTTGSGSGASLSCAVPAGVASGDIVVLAATIDAPNPVTFSWPASFTQLANVAVTAENQAVGSAWKRLTGADAGTYTVTTGGVSSEWILQATAFTGRHATDPPTASSAQQNTLQSSPVSVNAATVTAVAGDDLCWISGPDVNAGDIGTGHTAPPSYTEREDTENGWCNLSAATWDNVSAGATGTVTGTFALASGQAGWAAVLVRVPAAAGGGATVRRYSLPLTGMG